MFLGCDVAQLGHIYKRKTIYVQRNSHVVHTHTKLCKLVKEKHLLVNEKRKM